MNMAWKESFVLTRNIQMKVIFSDILQVQLTFQFKNETENIYFQVQQLDTKTSPSVLIPEKNIFYVKHIYVGYNVKW